MSLLWTKSYGVTVINQMKCLYVLQGGCNFSLEMKPCGDHSMHSSQQYFHNTTCLLIPQLGNDIQKFCPVVTLACLARITKGSQADRTWKCLLNFHNTANCGVVVLRYCSTMQWSKFTQEYNTLGTTLFTILEKKKNGTNKIVLLSYWLI